MAVATVASVLTEQGISLGALLAAGVGRILRLHLPFPSLLLVVVAYSAQAWPSLQQRGTSGIALGAVSV